MLFWTRYIRWKTDRLLPDEVFNLIRRGMINKQFEQFQIVVTFKGNEQRNSDRVRRWRRTYLHRWSGKASRGRWLFKLNSKGWGGRWGRSSQEKADESLPHGSEQYFPKKSVTSQVPYLWVVNMSFWIITSNSYHSFISKLKRTLISTVPTFYF